MALERVYAVWDYWDGIRCGFADCYGRPHYFDARWDEASDDYSEVFELTAVSPATIELVMEQAKIFRSWSNAFHRGEATRESHPALPGQNDHYAHLAQTIRAAIGSAKLAPRTMRGRFEAIPGQDHLPPGVIRSVRVEWSEP